MSVRPTIAEPELLERLGLNDDAFRDFIAELLARLPPRDYDESALARAIGYPWERPRGSYRLAEGKLARIEEMPPERWERLVGPFVEPASGRLPILAFGSNGAPGTLRRKFAHFPDENDRAVLALTGRLHDFDVGASAQPAFYGAMPATLFPSPGTEVCATILWVTPAQFTQLTWSELSYSLGTLHTRFEADDGEDFDEVLAFVSRFGAFCPEGEPVALAAVPARGRTATALTQEEILAAAAVRVIGPEAGAEALVRAIFEDAATIAPRIAAALHPGARRFESERWTPFDPHTAR